MITLNIPLPAYLYKYLTKLYTCPYTPNVYDELGVVILSVLERKMTFTNSTAPKTWKGKVADNYFVVNISLSQFKNNGFYIFNEKIRYIQTFVDNQFRMTMYRAAVINYHQFDIAYKDSILTFLETYDIKEEEFSYESIRKDFNRKVDVLRSQLCIK